ncbi:MAG: hypothetical protein A2X11_11850 [Bacteroidetes bacterium GWE2_42_24]|nr:MAG: hypothetical protein A2X11_11850 [Bacteroidetes bacterium GWE2_42_24]OFY25443.1 MAG: hypothetical protein A2X09_12785 [Bacteroidetes bacterium GWF2_43_11]HCT84511.1 hypothetical protein [Candidatus Margulisiibacteriota bacterium]
MMEIFINEKSLDEQFDNEHDFLVGVNTFIDLLQAASEIKADRRLTFYNELFFSLNLIRGKRFDTSIKRNNDLNTRFFLNLQTLAPKSWFNSRIHTNENTYEYFGGECNDTSIAEIAERRLSTENYKGLLINFIKSGFGETLEIPVIKNKDCKRPINVSCTFDRASLYNWLNSNGYILPNKRKFEHHKQKHDRIRPTQGNSILLCTDDEAQKLLDSAIHENSPFDNRLYNFDAKYKKVIIFNRHTALTYHGYHIDDLSTLPSSIKKELEGKFTKKN